jgi:hypothetical protein
MWVLPLVMLLVHCASAEPADPPDVECTEPADPVCDDEEECTVDTCNVATGMCSNMQVADDTACDQGRGKCQAGICDKCFEDDGTRKDCDDQNECTFNECQPATGFCLSADKPDGAQCTYQNGLGMCVGGDCAEATPCEVDADCEDDNECTFNECDMDEGFCLFQNVSNGTECQAEQGPGTCMSGVCLESRSL